MPRYTRVRAVDEDGVLVHALDDHPLDLCVDGRRVWTFWTLRDTEAVARPLPGLPWPVRRAAWPKPLVRFLDGRATITLRDSATGRTHFDAPIAFGGGDGPIRVQNRRGIDLGMDKSGRLVPTFAGRSDIDIAALMDATETVLEALRSAGVEPFLAYGTLLGAVREGRVLGHDSDADLGYVSQHKDPVDVTRESFRIQRQLARRGLHITRYSGAAFKIHVTEADVTRGLDVFGGFIDAGRLHLMGEIGVPFEREWILPLGVAELEGRPMPVPARPDKLLEATYGPGWRTPDPAFKFTTPDRTVRAFNEWFRGTQPGIRHWDRRAGRLGAGPLPSAPSLPARAAARAARQLGAEVLDVGAGRGADSLWLARRGLTVTAYDYVERALGPARDQAVQESLALTARHLNLTEWRSVLAEGARLAQRPGPRVVLARHVLEATSAEGRAGLARLCSMALRDGGRLIADFFVVPEDADDLPEWVVGRPDAEVFTTLLREAGASEVRVQHRDRGGRSVVRVVGVW